RKGGPRRSLLEEISGSRHTAVIYESPQRIAALLQDLAEVAGADRRVAVARELTKMHEEIVRLPLGEAVNADRDRTIRGEVVVVVEGAQEAPDSSGDDTAARAMAE